MARITYSKQTDADLQDIWLWIARDSVGSADAFLRRMLRRIEILRSFRKPGRFAMISAVARAVWCPNAGWFCIG